MKFHEFHKSEDCFGKNSTTLKQWQSGSDETTPHRVTNQLTHSGNPSPCPLMWDRMRKLEITCIFKFYERKSGSTLGPPMHGQGLLFCTTGIVAPLGFGTTVLHQNWSQQRQADREQKLPPFFSETSRREGRAIKYPSRDQLFSRTAVRGGGICQWEAQRGRRPQDSAMGWGPEQ